MTVLLIYRNDDVPIAQLARWGIPQEQDGRVESLLTAAKANEVSIMPSQHCSHIFSWLNFTAYGENILSLEIQQLLLRIC